MGLSDREQRLLDQMEQALYAEDPRFATQMQGVARPSRQRHLIGAAGVLLGLGLVLVGINTTWIVGALGFLVMVGALAYAFTPARTKLTVVGGTPGTAKARTASKSPGRKAPGSGTFMQRMESRWDRRRNQW